MYDRTYGIDAARIHRICGPLEIKFEVICVLDTGVFQEVGTERSFVTSYFLHFEWIYARYSDGKKRERASEKCTIADNKGN